MLDNNIKLEAEEVRYLLELLNNRKASISIKEDTKEYELNKCVRVKLEYMATPEVLKELLKRGVIE